jgi:Rrf2 family iron-sulfur cluster assembly transcriptional regulator
LQQNNNKMFSKACEHAIKAMIYIATQSLENKRVKIGDVAKHTGSPEAYTAKILGTLNKQGIVNSLTGPYGGFEMNGKMMKQTKVSDIVFAIDGDSVYNGCGLGLSECSEEKPCPIHNEFVKVRSELKAMLETTSLFDLATKLQSGEATLVR